MSKRCRSLGGSAEYISTSPLFRLTSGGSTAGMVVAFFVVLLLSASPSRAFEVPLTIWETAGVDRQQEICSTGVPLPCGLLHEPAGLAVFDSAGTAVPAQFRVLERWRDTGEGRDDLSIRWLLVTFLADVPADQHAVYHLKRGANPVPSEPLRIDQDADGYRMGGLTFRKDFTAPFALELTDPDGKRIGTEGQQIQWSVWEDGPVRACLRAESATDHSRFGFIAWIYAYAGQKRWDMTVVLKNTPNEAQGPFYLRDFSVVWQPPEARTGREFLLGGQWGRAVAGCIEGDQPVYVMQASDGTDRWDALGDNNGLVMDWTPDKAKCRAGQGGFRGYRVLSGEQQLGTGDFAAGWAAVNTTQAGVWATVRDYHHQWPKATEVNTGTITLRLWPKYAQGFGGLHWLDDCTRKAHDLSFRLSETPLTADQGEAADKAFDHPLVAHVLPEWSLAAGAWRMSPERRIQPFAGGGASAQTASGRNWVTWGGDVSDRIRRRYHQATLEPFACGGDPAEAYRLARTARHSAGMTPLWLDEYQYPRDVDKLTHAQYCGLARKAGTYRPDTWHYGFMTWNASHFCCQELFDAWRLFGDPLALEAIGTVGRWCQAYVDFREGGGNLVAGTRADGLPLYNLCEAYRILGDPSMRESLDRFAELCWRQVDKQRGNYGVMDSWEGGQERCEKPFMMAQVMQGLRDYWEVTGDQRAVDQFVGMADFILAESSLGPWGFHYVVLIDPEQNRERLAQKRRELDEDSRPDGQKNLSYGHLAWVMAWAHRQTGETRFRQAVDGLNRHAYPHVPWAYTGYHPERSDAEPPAAITDLRAERLDNGRVRLRWTAPLGEPTRYQVKWARSPIVERLEYPAEKDTKTNWWAAEIVANPPAPAAAGTDQSFIVAAAPPSPCWFAIRSFDAHNNRSAISNQAQVP
ncbi:MAG: hypothetical protein KJ000_22190 [Pirellulaceae bacterium]|nr:hypothetical protein [Pirellulaceae bacterium]